MVYAFHPIIPPSSFSPPIPVPRPLPTPYITLGIRFGIISIQYLHKRPSASTSRSSSLLNKTHPSGSRINAKPFSIPFPSPTFFLNLTPILSKRSHALATSSTESARWPNPLEGPSSLPEAYACSGSALSCVSSRRPIHVKCVRFSKIPLSMGGWPSRLRLVAFFSSALSACPSWLNARK